MHTLQKRTRILFIIFCFHVAVCLTFIFFNSFLRSTKISRFYKVYIMPGPFFSEATIVQSNHLQVSWKEKNKWTAPANDALEQFNLYQATGNPVYLNKSRLERALVGAIIKKQVNKNDTIRLSTQSGLMQYGADRVIPVKSDSASIAILIGTPGKKDSVLFSQKVRLKDE